MAVKKGKYDIVHAHFGLTLISTLLVRKPVVITFHGSDLLVSPTKYISKLLAPTATRVIVVADKLRKALGHGEVIPCGIDTQKFSLPLGFSKMTYPKNPDRLKVLFPSDPARKIKNYHLFMKVCLELRNEGYDVEEIHLVNIDRESVHKVFWECDLMLLTSLSEGSPTVIKEAIAAKLPFVSVDVGDVREWTDKIDFGVVVADRKPSTMAYSAKELILRIDARENLDNKKCIEQFENKNISKRIKEIYDHILL